MRHSRLLLPVIGAMSFAGGCHGPDRGIIKQLPDPIVSPRPAKTYTYTPTPPPPVVQPSPPPVVQLRAEPPEAKPASGNPTGWRPPKGFSRKWQCIVIHHSATPHGGARKFDNDHKALGWDELGYHFVIGNGTDTANGSVEVGPRWTKQKHGAHCKSPDNYYNEHGIGICLVGNFEKQSPTAAQMSALARLVRYLMSECGIPASKVMTHAQCKATVCPGKFFSLAGLKRQLANPATMSSMGE